MSGAEISALFAVWSITALVAEVPSGALSDRFSRRRVLAAGGALQAGAYVLWLLAPGFAGFAAGFVLWGIGTSLYSGTVEALAFEGLSAAGVPERYATVRGLVVAAGHAAQIPSAVAATVLLAVGGYSAVGWVSVGTCLAASLVTCSFPDPPRAGPPPEDDEDDREDQEEDDGEEEPELSHLGTLRAGLAEAVGSGLVRGAMVAAALVGGIDALEEYFPLIVGQQEGVPLLAVPALLIVVAAAGAGGAALGGRAGRLQGRGLAVLVLLAGIALAVTPAGGVLGLAALAAFHGLQQCAQIVTDARVQERLSGRARATATSVSALLVELLALAVFAAWGLGGTLAVAAGVLAIAPVVWWVLRPRVPARSPRSG